jgi:multicomponent Na+:H+ antiporter subunit B
MSRLRAGAALAGLALILAGLVWADSGLPGFGHYDHRYGAVVAHETVPTRSATNAVVVTAFDFRAFDTLGEEFILFISVIGVLVLLRRLRDEDEPESSEAGPAAHNSATELQRWAGRAALGPLLVLAAYVVVHGHLTPGGGFQGGVLIAAAALAVFVGGDYELLLRLRASSAVELGEAIGASGLVLLALGGLLASGTFFQNFIAKGSSGLLTGGFIPLANLSVGLEVGGAVLIVLSELLDRRVVQEQR